MGNSAAAEVSATARSKMVTYDRASREVVWCLFCDIVSGKAPGHRLYMDKVCCAFLPRDGDAAVHVLVVPKRHIQNAKHLEPEDLELVKHLQRVGSIVAGRISALSPHPAGGDNPAIAAAFGAVPDCSLLPVSSKLAARERALAPSPASACEACRAAWNSTLHPTAPTASTPGHAGAADAEGLVTAFHAPPYNSIDHLHLHALVPPFAGLVFGWQGALSHNTMMPWSPSADAVCDALEASSREARL
jgi:hypothetical protein